MNNRLIGNRASVTGIWKRVGILAAVFVVAVIVISAVTNRGSDDLTVDLEAATLPRVHFLVVYHVVWLCGLWNCFHGIT